MNKDMILYIDCQENLRRRFPKLFVNPCDIKILWFVTCKRKVHKVKTKFYSEGFGAA